MATLTVAHTHTHTNELALSHACIHIIIASHSPPLPSCQACVTITNAQTVCQIRHIMKPINARYTFVLNMLHKPQWLSAHALSDIHMT